MTRAIALTALLLGACAQAPRGDFSFALIGDLGYTAAQEPMVDHVLESIDAATLAFVVHDGDLGAPRSGSCTDELWARRLAQFQALRHPVIYTPGDNEWTDCHAGEVTGYEARQRLGGPRPPLFLPRPRLGQRPPPPPKPGGPPPKSPRGRGGRSVPPPHVGGGENNPR